MHTRQSVNVSLGAVPAGWDSRRPQGIAPRWIADPGATEFRRATRVAALPRQARGRSGKGAAGNGSCPGVPWQVRRIKGGIFLVDFWARVRPVARRLSVPGAMMSYPRLNCASPPRSYKNEVSRNAALWASACRDTSKGGRVNATLPFQNDGERLLHGVYFVRLTFHFDEYVLFIAPAARGTAAANHDPTV